MDPLNTQPVPDQTLTPEGEQQGELTQEQMRSNLEELMGRIESKYQDFNSERFSSDNQIQDQKNQSLRDLFSYLRSVGVDPSNVEEVRAFLDKMKEQTPELAQQFEQALQILLGEEISPEQNSVEEPNPNEEQNMNINIPNEETQQNL